MIETKESFITSWQSRFPNCTIPDVSFFYSKIQFENEELRCQQRLKLLKNEIDQEEFILDVIKKLKQNPMFVQSLESRNEKPKHLMSVSEQLSSMTKIELMESNSDKMSFTSFMCPQKVDSKSPRFSLPNITDVNNDKMLASNKSQSVDEVKLLKQRPCKPQRRMTGSNAPPRNPPPVMPKSLPRNFSISKCAEKAGQLDKSAKILNANNDPLTDTSDDDDDDHIYTDISQLTIDLPLRTPVYDEPDESDPFNNDDEIYQNAQMKPKLEKIASVESDNDDNEKTSKQTRKRHGSEDRKAFLFSDDIQVSNEQSLDHGDAESVFPSIVVDTHDEDDEEDPYEEDEHIYANVDELRLLRQSDDSGSESDFNIGLKSSNGPTTVYREMTADEIESLQKWRESDEDLSQSQDDDSDEGGKQVKRNRRPNSTFGAPKNSCQATLSIESSPVLKLRTASSPEKNKLSAEVVKEGVCEEELQLIKAARMRKYLVMNLLDTEKCYYDCLEMMIKFMKPLRLSIESSQPLLTMADYKSIFHQAEELFILHKEFLQDLEPRIASWSDCQLIGDLFTIIMHDFSTYSSYIGNYKHAMDTVAKCNAKQQFKDIMNQDIKIPSLKVSIKLEALLYKPVDRITQYSLILNDLLKYTPPEHPDHPLIVEVSGAVLDLLEQVNVDTSKKKKRQRQLLKEATVVEIEEGHRSPRSLILYNDVIISAKLKTSRDTFVCKWYAALADINLKPYSNSEAPCEVPLSSKAECDKLRASIANLRAEIRKEHNPLQGTVSVESVQAFGKRRNIQPSNSSRSSSRGVEKLKKKIVEQERVLQLITPNVPLKIFHKNGKVYTLLMAVESEYQAWTDALKPRLKRIHARNAESIHMSSLELQQAFETVLKVQRLGARFGSNMPAPFLGPTRPYSLDFSQFDDKDSLTGFLYVNILTGKGFNRNSDTYVVLEMDSYGHYFKKAKTKPSRGSDPHWDEAFDFEIEACTGLRLTCFNKLRLMGDDVSGKVTVNLTRENLLDNKNHALALSLDRGQSSMNISLCFATSVDGIKKSKSLCESGVYGVPISVVCRREKSDIPVVVISCVREIEKRGMDEIGIYRLSGIASEIQSLKKAFNENTQNAVLALTDADIHAVAGLLKLYFRELPQSLFTGKLYHKFVEGLSIREAEDKELYMLDILHEMPRINKMTALYLFEHLRRVSRKEEINKMGVNNLATVFGPTVLRATTNLSEKENERSSCTVGTFDIGALDVMSQVGIFRYFLALKNNPRTTLPEDDLELWRRLDPEKAAKLEEKLMDSAEEFLI